MTPAHFIFIPGVMAVGVVVGFFLGGRAARDAAALAQKRDQERAVARAARQAARPKED